MRKHLRRLKAKAAVLQACRAEARANTRAKAGREEGFTLVEAIIAAALAMIVLSSALSAFNSSMGLADTSRIVSETNHSLQAAMSLMVRDLLQTGQGIPTGGIPLPSGAGASAVVRPAPGTATFPSTWETLPAISPGSALGPTVLGVTTDIINIVYRDPTIDLNEFPLDSIAPSGLTMTVNAGTNIGGADGLRPGDLILFSNPNGNAMQVVTAVSGQDVTMSPSDPMNLNQPGAAAGNLLAIADAGVFPPTTAVRVMMVSYYVDVVTDPTLPRLVRRINNGPQLAIALGVENVQFTYDIVDGATNPINVDAPSGANSPHQIRKVRLTLSARSLDPGPVTHQFMRNTMATDVGLRSLSYVDRYK